MLQSFFFILLVLALLVTPVTCGKGQNTPEWGQIPECIMGVAVEYESHINITGVEDVRRAFTEFTDYASENDVDVFGYGSNWRFDEAAKQGTYESTKYWRVMASWYSEDDDIWHQKNVFSVSEGGDVVRLLGCV